MLITEKNDQMNQLLNEKDQSNIKLCFESFLITEDEQKSKNINFYNLYAFIKQMHYEMDLREQKMKINRSFWSSTKQRIKKLFGCQQNQNPKCQKRQDDSPTKRKSNNKKDFFVFQVFNIHTDTSFFVRIKSVYLDCPLIMIIFENQDIVKSNNRLKKQIEISNILNTSFFFEVSKKCEMIKWAMKEKQNDYVEFLFSLLQNNIYSIRRRQEKIQKDQYASPLLKRRLDQSTLLASSPNLKFQFSMGNEVKSGKLNLSKLFTSITQNNNSPCVDQKVSIQNMKQSLGMSLAKQMPYEGNSFINEKKSVSMDVVDKQLSQNSAEYDTNSIFDKSPPPEDQFSEMTIQDLNLKKQLERNYQFQHLYKNNFQRTQSLEVDENLSKQDDSKIKIINLQTLEQDQSLTNQKQGQNINKISTIGTISNLVQVPSSELFSSLKVPQNTQQLSNKQSEFYKQNLSGSNIQFSPYSQAYSKSIEKFKKQQTGNIHSPLVEQNKRNSLKLVQEILLYQINQLTSHNDKNLRVSGSFNRNYQFSSSVFEKELLSPTRERELSSCFDFSDIFHELQVYGKMLNMNFDAALRGLKIYNDKEAIVYILKSFFSSIIALNYLRDRFRKKQLKANEKLNYEKQKKENTDETINLKSYEQLRNYAISLRDYSNTKISKKASVASIQSNTNQNCSNTPKYKEVTFYQQMQNHFSLKKSIRNSNNFSPTMSPYKMKLHQVNCQQKEVEDSKNSLYHQNTITNLNKTLLKLEKADKNIKIPTFLCAQSPSSYGEKSSIQTDINNNNKINDSIDEQLESQLQNSSPNYNTYPFLEDIKVEFLLETKQLTKNILIRISNIDKEDLVRCLNFNTNAKISEMEYENIKEIIQRIGPQPLYHESGKILFAFLVDINQVYINDYSPKNNQFRQQKSDINDNLGMIPEEQEIAKSVIKLSSAAN